MNKPTDTRRVTTIAHDIREHMARAFFATAWAEQCEEAGQENMLSGRDIMDLMPADVDAAAYHAADTLIGDLINGHKFNSPVTDRQALALLYLTAAKSADGDRNHTADNFGHYVAMQAMGSGVGLRDAFGPEAAESIAVPFVEFGGHSLQKDYF